MFPPFSSFMQTRPLPSIGTVNNLVHSSSVLIRQHRLTLTLTFNILTFALLLLHLYPSSTLVLAAALQSSKSSSASSAILDIVLSFTAARAPSISSAPSSFSIGAADFPALSFSGNGSRRRHGGGRGCHDGWHVSNRYPSLNPAPASVARVTTRGEAVCATPYPALHLLSCSLPSHSPTQMTPVSQRSSSACACAPHRSSTQMGLRQWIIDVVGEVPELPVGWDAITDFIFVVVQI